MSEGYPSEPIQIPPVEPSEQPRPDQPSAPREKVLLPVVLFLLTVVTTVVAGFLLHLDFVSQSQEEYASRLLRAIAQPGYFLQGLPFSVTLLVILLAHEMGHYLACRYYGLRATLPYVIPAPPPLVFFGTVGAVIRIKSLFRDRKQLFDVGVAGPLAGFVFIIPALIIGIQNSHELTITSDSLLEFGEPLMFRWVVHFFYSGGSGEMIVLHPIGYAAWFGALATSLNLLPFGQLDGGHMVYALFGARKHRFISRITLFGLVGLSFLSWPIFGYLFFALVLVFMGARHPRPRFDDGELGRGRVIIALIAAIIFIISFIPIPIRIVSNLGRL